MSPKNLYLSAEEVLSLTHQLYIVDLRDGCGGAGADDDLSAGLPGAKTVSGKALLEGTADLPKNRPILLYCQFGMIRSVVAATQLRKEGYDVYFLQNGFSGWKKAGYPTEVRQR